MNKKEQAVAIKTMAIKTRVYNQIRKALYRKRLDEFTPQEKQKLFDEIHTSNMLAHWELIHYKNKRKAKAIVHAERVKRGYVKKQKTPKPGTEKQDAAA